MLALLLFPGSPSSPEDEEPPIAGRPAHFNGAIGIFRITAEIDRTEVEAEDPVTYTVNIAAAGSVLRPPQRPNLHEFSAFEEAFYIEEVPPLEGTKRDKEVWEFRWLLRPKSVAVEAVPGFPFVSYKPGVLPARLGYRTTYAPSIPLKVKARGQVGGGSIETGPIDAPAGAWALVEGPALSRQESRGRLPAWGWLLLLVLLPPAGCTAWRFLWKRWYPDAARLAEQRRSRAARDAFDALTRIDKEDESIPRIAAVLAGYLRQRLDLRIHEPTPQEAESHLKQSGLSAAVAAQTADFMRSCDAARFNPTAALPPDLKVKARELILTLEEQTWLSSSC